MDSSIICYDYLKVIFRVFPKWCYDLTIFNVWDENMILLDREAIMYLSDDKSSPLLLILAPF